MFPNAPNTAAADGAAAACACVGGAPYAVPAAPLFTGNPFCCCCCWYEEYIGAEAAEGAAAPGPGIEAAAGGGITGGGVGWCWLWW